MDKPSQFDWLSPSGEERRREILGLALAAAPRRRYHRRAAGVVYIAAIVGCLVTLEFSLRPQTPRQIELLRPPPSSGSVPILFVQTDPDIVKRLAVPSEPPSWQMLSDDELLQTLAAQGKPAGLAYVDGREVLWTGP